MLRGARGLLGAHAPLLFCGIESRHRPDGSVSAVLDWLRAAGFDGHFLSRSRLVPIAKFDPAVHQAAAGDRIRERRGYCSNFVLRRSR